MDFVLIEEEQFHCNKMEEYEMQWRVGEEPSLFLDGIKIKCYVENGEEII